MNFSRSSNRIKRLGGVHLAERMYSRVWLYVLRIACVAVLVAGVAAAGALLGTFMGIVHEAPEISLESFQIDKLSSYIYDAKGKEIYKLRTETNRIYVDIDHITADDHQIVRTNDKLSRFGRRKP